MNGGCMRHVGKVETVAHCVGHSRPCMACGGWVWMWQGLEAPVGLEGGLRDTIGACGHLHPTSHGCLHLKPALNSITWSSTSRSEKWGIILAHSTKENSCLSAAWHILVTGSFCMVSVLWEHGLQYDLLNNIRHSFLMTGHLYWYWCRVRQSGIIN